MMIEVFKTNVDCCEQARLLVQKIHHYFPDYQANFDTEDCDHILRIKSLSGSINADSIIRLLNTVGFKAEVLLDELI